MNYSNSNIQYYSDDLHIEEEKDEDFDDDIDEFYDEEDDFDQEEDYEFDLDDEDEFEENEYQKYLQRRNIFILKT
jgi:hypothetical protein